MPKTKSPKKEPMRFWESPRYKRTMEIVKKYTLNGMCLDQIKLPNDGVLEKYIAGKGHLVFVICERVHSQNGGDEEFHTEVMVQASDKNTWEDFQRVLTELTNPITPEQAKKTDIQEELAALAEEGNGCDGCDGSGIREQTNNGQVYSGENCLLAGEQIVERCDTCELYGSDREAAEARFNSVREIVSVDKFHSIAASGRKPEGHVEQPE